MHYVKYFDILGVNTAQIPCIELQGVPNSATEGVVGLLGMDMTSEDKEVYICTAVNGAIYTWKSLKDGRDGVSVRKAEIHDNGELVLTLSDGSTINAGVVKGENGVKGSDGKDGVTPTIRVGTVKTGEPDSEVIVENSGSSTEVVLDISIPRGKTGERGGMVDKNTKMELSLFVGTEDEWNVFPNKTNVLWFPTDDKTLEEIDERITKLDEECQRKIPWVVIDLASYGDDSPPAPYQSGVYEVFLHNDVGQICCGFGTCYYVGSVNDGTTLDTEYGAYFPVVKHSALEYWLYFLHGQIHLMSRDTINNGDWKKSATGKVYYRRICDLEE